jgi:CRP-like cAMP-binding protein
VNNIGVVLNGELCVCNERDGKRTTVQSIEENQLIGESALFSTQSQLSHRVIAEKDAKVLFLTGDFFMVPCDKSCELRDEHKIIVRNMLRLLSDKAALLGKKVAYLTANDLRTKIAMYLCELYEISRSRTFAMPLNRDRLAEFFSVARPSLSRELTGLKNDGVIDFHRSSVEILDLDLLYHIAEGQG